MEPKNRRVRAVVHGPRLRSHLRRAQRPERVRGHLALRNYRHVQHSSIVEETAQPQTSICGSATAITPTYQYHTTSATS